MPTTEIYDRMIDDLMSGNQLERLERQILTALRHAPNGIDRAGLIWIIFGTSKTEIDDLSRDVRDRKIRKAISALRLMGVPIAANSGESGYRLETDPAKLQVMRQELLHRRENIERQAKALEQMIWRLEHDPHYRPTTPSALEQHPQQLGLFGGSD